MKQIKEDRNNTDWQNLIYWYLQIGVHLRKVDKTMDKDQILVFRNPLNLLGHNLGSSICCIIRSKLLHHCCTSTLHIPQKYSGIYSVIVA